MEVQLRRHERGQGLELAYIGVIIGPDLIARDDTVITDASKRSSRDQTIRGYKKMLKKNPERAGPGGAGNQEYLSDVDDSGAEGLFCLQHRFSDNQIHPIGSRKLGAVK